MKQLPSLLSDRWETEPSTSSYLFHSELQSLIHVSTLPQCCFPLCLCPLSGNVSGVCFFQTKETITAEQNKYKKFGAIYVWCSNKFNGNPVPANHLPTLCLLVTCLPSVYWLAHSQDKPPTAPSDSTPHDHCRHLVQWRTELFNIQSHTIWNLLVFPSATLLTITKDKISNY